MYNAGLVPAASILYIPFDTYAGATGASITLSGLAVGDILIYKNGSTTQRASTNGYALLDTDGIDFDGITGIHGISIDLADNSDAGFYAAGSQYWVIISSVTVDSQTVNFVACAFRITAAEVLAGFPAVYVSGTASNAITASSFASDAITAAKVASDVGQEIADRVLNRNLATNADGGDRTVQNALRALRNKVVIDPVGNTITVYQEDDTAVAWSGTIAAATRDPINTVDPA